MSSVENIHPIRSQRILRSTNERKQKLWISKIKRSNSFCVKFKSVHCGYRDQANGIIKLYPTQSLDDKNDIMKYCFFSKIIIQNVI